MSNDEYAENLKKAIDELGYFVNTYDMIYGTSVAIKEIKGEEDPDYKEGLVLLDEVYENYLKLSQYIQHILDGPLNLTISDRLIRHNPGVKFV